MSSNDNLTYEQLLLKFQDEQKNRKEAERKVLEAEQKVLDEQKTRKEAERKLQVAEDKARGLRWPEALSLWHTIFSNPPIRYRHEEIQPSGFTTPIGRRHPTELVHWTNFHNEHKSAFSLLCNQFAKPEARAFKSREFYQDDAERFMSHCVLDDEVALVAYEQRTVEELVINVWQQKEGDNKIGFKSREDKSLDDLTLRLKQMNTGKKSAPKTPKKQEPLYEKKRLYDKVCYIILGKDGRRDLLVVEYKAADKLTPVFLLEGLHQMNIVDIINRVKISTNKAEKTKEKAEEAIAIVVTQTYDYMIDQGLSYGYINGGKTFIFLFVDPEKPKTLLYESVILEDLPTTSSIVPEEELRFTAVGLVAGFAQMALSKQPWGKEFRSKARNQLPIWKKDDARMLDSITPISTSKSINGSPDFEQPDDYHTLPDTSPSETRRRVKEKEALARGQRSDAVLARLPKDDDDSRGTKGNTRLGGAKSKSGFIQSSSKLGKNTTTETNNGKQGSSNDNGKNKGAATFVLTLKDSQACTGMPDRPYCTQACLLGLIRGHTLDKKCPNVKAHQKKAHYYSRNTPNRTLKRRRHSNNRHAINQPVLARLMDQQLQGPERDYDGGFKSLERSGWAGALFRLELLSHGYTFVGKGTVQPLVPVLEFEADMYKRMKTIQGKAIPVYLGSVDLAAAFHLTTRTAIVHLMLLSWAGEEAWRCGIEPERLWLETLRTHHEVAALGVQQGDLRRPNVLWNYELDRAILIDFEYAHIDEEHDTIELATAGKIEATEQIKVLGQTTGNKASCQAEAKIDQPISLLLSDVC